MGRGAGEGSSQLLGLLERRTELPLEPWSSGAIATASVTPPLLSLTVYDLIRGPKLDGTLFGGRFCLIGYSQDPLIDPP